MKAMAPHSSTVAPIVSERESDNEPRENCSHHHRDGFGEEQGEFFIVHYCLSEEYLHWLNFISLYFDFLPPKQPSD